MPVDNELRKRMNLPVKEETSNDNQGTTSNDNQGTNNLHDNTTDDQGQGNAGQGNTGAGASGTTNSNQTNNPPDDTRISDDELLKILQERNPNIKSLNDIARPAQTPLTEEQLRRKKVKNMIAWAIKNEKISTEKYNQYHIDSAKPPRQIVYEDYSRRRKAQGVQDDQKIDREFRALYHEDVDDKDPDAVDVSQLAQAKIAQEAKRIVRRAYPEMITIEREYDRHVETVKKTREQSAQTTQLVSDYRKDVLDVTTEFSKKKFIYTVGDKQKGESFDIPFEFSPQAIEQVKNEFLTENAFQRFSANYSKQTVSDAIHIRLLMITDAQRSAHIASQYHKEMAKRNKTGRNALSMEETGVGATASVLAVDEEARNRVRPYIKQPG